MGVEDHRVQPQRADAALDFLGRGGRILRGDGRHAREPVREAGDGGGEFVIAGPRQRGAGRGIEDMGPGGGQGEDLHIDTGGVHVGDAPFVQPLQPLDDRAGARARAAQVEAPHGVEADVIDALARQHVPVLAQHVGGREGLLGRDAPVGAWNAQSQVRFPGGYWRLTLKLSAVRQPKQVRMIADYTSLFGREPMSKYQPNLDLEKLVAIDIHTHATISGRAPRDPCAHAFDEQMVKYFRSGKAPTIAEVAQYYRERNLAAVIFTVDAEAGAGHWRIANEEVAEVAAENNDVLIPFASIDPARGKMGVREARRLIEDYGVRGFKFHPSTQAFYPERSEGYPLYEVIAARGSAGAVPYRPDRGGGGRAGGHGRQAQVLESDVPGRRRGRFPDPDDRHGASLVSLAGRGAGGGDAQAEYLHRPVGLVAEIFPAEPHPIRQHAVQGPGAVRLGLPGHHT